MALTVNETHESPEPLDATGDPAHSDTDRADSDPGSAQRRLADQLLDELTHVKAVDRSRMFRMWQRSGVSVIQLSAANMLECEGPMSMSRLAEALGISVASATGVVDRMEERALVVRHHDVRDRRLVIVSPAPGAADLMRALELARREHLSHLVEQLSEDELAGFLTGLRALRAARERLETSAS